MARSLIQPTYPICSPPAHRLGGKGTLSSARGKDTKFKAEPTPPTNNAPSRFNLFAKPKNKETKN